MSKPIAKVPNHKTSENDFSRKLQNLERESKPVLKKLWQKLVELLKKIRRGIMDLWHRFLRSFAAWVDPKLEPYRESKGGKFAQKPKVVVTEEIYAPIVSEAPQTRAELMELIHDAPMNILNASERKAITAVLDLAHTTVLEIMTPAVKIVFVNQDETLGPLVLDRLYRSGFTFFPVIDGRQHIIGVLPTALLNSLDVKETNIAAKVMDPRVYYIRSDYTLEQALKAFLRTNSQLMLVVDKYEKLVGMLTFAQMLDYLFDEKYQDDFDRDDDRLAVAKRR